MSQVLSRLSRGSPGIISGLSFCFCGPFYGPHNVCCLTVILIHQFVWWFLTVKAGGWSGLTWSLLQGPLSVFLRITVCSLMPGSSALKLSWSWPPEGLLPVGTPLTSVHCPVLPLFPCCPLGPVVQGYGGLMARLLVGSHSLGKWISSACLFYPLPVELSLSQIRVSISP